MPKPLCAQCFTEGFCRYLRVQLITDAQISNPDFIRDLRAYSAAMRRTRDGWLGFLTDAYRDYPGTVVDRRGDPVYLDMSVFEAPGIPFWFRDFANKPSPPGGEPYIRRDVWERVRVFATILTMLDPAAARMWGVRAANDETQNAPQPPAEPRHPRARCPAMLSLLYGLNDNAEEDDERA